MWKALAVVLALLAVFILVDTMAHSGDPDDVAMAAKIVLIAIGVLAFAFLFPWMWRPHETPGYEMVRAVTREGIHVQDATERCFIPWEHIARARSSDSIGIIYSSRTSTAYIFPRRMFLSQEGWSGFCELLNTKTLAI